MYRTVAVVIAAIAVALVQTGFVSALPAPAASVSLPLLLVVWLITSFRFSDAYAAVLAAGITGDALSSLPRGTHTLVLAATCAVTMFLFTRVFTHHSRRGNLALHAGAFGLAAAALALVQIVRGTLVGLPLLPEFNEPWWRLALAALGAQLGIALGAMLLAALGRRMLGRTYRNRSYAR
jgi:hypothetical protein